MAKQRISNQARREQELAASQTQAAPPKKVEPFVLQPGVPVPGPEGNIDDKPGIRPYVPKYSDLRPGDGFQNWAVRWILYRVEPDYCIMGAEGWNGHRYDRSNIESTLKHKPFVPRPEDWADRYASAIEAAADRPKPPPIESTEVEGSPEEKVTTKKARQTGEKTGEKSGRSTDSNRRRKA